MGQWIFRLKSEDFAGIDGRRVGNADFKEFN